MSDEVISYYDDGKSIYQKEWFLNGKLHKEDGPAVIGYYLSGDIEYEVWYLNGNEHRTDGPSYVEYAEYYNPESDEAFKIIFQCWYLNGKQFWPEDWLAKNGYKWPLTEDQQTEFLLVFG